MTNLHDIFAKKVFSDKAVFADLVQKFCPPEMVAEIDLDSLTLLPTAHVTAEMKEVFPDLAFDGRILDGRLARVILLLENKTNVPKFPHVQLGQYQFARFAEAREQKAGLLVPVVSILLYHGRRAYKKKPFLASFGHVSPVFARFIPEFDYVLIDLRACSDEQIEALERTRLMSVLLLMKHAYDEETLVKKAAEIFDFDSSDMSQEETQAFFETLFLYFCLRIRTDKAEVIQKVKFNMRQQTRQGTLLDLWETSLLNTGEKKGMEKGMEKGMMKIIVALMKSKSWHSDAELAEMAGWSIETIRKIREEINKKQA